MFILSLFYVCFMFIIVVVVVECLTFGQVELPEVSMVVVDAPVSVPVDVSGVSGSSIQTSPLLSRGYYLRLSVCLHLPLLAFSDPIFSPFTTSLGGFVYVPPLQAPEFTIMQIQKVP